MKETKYRVWDKKYGKYLGGKILLAPDGQLYEVVDDFHFPKINMDEVTVEQCTGLKDKNGKEIYGGDRIKIEGSDTIYEVEYGRGVWVARFGDESGDNICLYHYTRKDTVLYAEVIGNIHENPELLKEENE